MRQILIKHASLMFKKKAVQDTNSVAGAVVQIVVLNGFIVYLYC